MNIDPIVIASDILVHNAEAFVARYRNGEESAESTLSYLVQLNNRMDEFLEDLDANSKT